MKTSGDAGVGLADIVSKGAGDRITNSKNNSALWVAALFSGSGFGRLRLPPQFRIDDDA